MMRVHAHATLYIRRERAVATAQVLVNGGKRRAEAIPAERREADHTLSRGWAVRYRDHANGLGEPFGAWQLA